MERSIKTQHVPFGAIHVVSHDPPDSTSILRPEGDKQIAVARNVVVAELFMLRQAVAAIFHQVAQQAVQEAAHEDQYHVIAGLTQNVVELRFRRPTDPAVAGSIRLHTNGDVFLEATKVILGKLPDDALGQPSAPTKRLLKLAMEKPELFKLPEDRFVSGPVEVRFGRTTRLPRLAAKHASLWPPGLDF
jgi:hypothetical protein